MKRSTNRAGLGLGQWIANGTLNRQCALGRQQVAAQLRLPLPFVIATNNPGKIACRTRGNLHM
jgi:hypothetical protein